MIGLHPTHCSHTSWSTPAGRGPRTPCAASQSAVTPAASSPHPVIATTQARCQQTARQQKGGSASSGIVMQALHRPADGPGHVTGCVPVGRGQRGRRARQRAGMQHLRWEKIRSGGGRSAWRGGRSETRQIGTGERRSGPAGWAAHPQQLHPLRRDVCGKAQHSTWHSTSHALSCARHVAPRGLWQSVVERAQLKSSDPLCMTVLVDVNVSSQPALSGCMEVLAGCIHVHFNCTTAVTGSITRNDGSWQL